MDIPLRLKSKTIEVSVLDNGEHYREDYEVSFIYDDDTKQDIYEFFSDYDKKKIRVTVELIG